MADMTFAEHVNIVANLDNSLSMSASLNRSGVALKVGSTYDVVSVLSVHNRTINQTEHTTISGTIASDTIGAYLSLLESTIEAAYPIAVTTSTTSTVSQVATMNTIGVELTLSGSEHYIRALNIKVSLAGVQQYDIDAELVNPLELTPNMLLFTPEALSQVSDIAADAQASADAADASELLAEKWATEAVDTVVLNGKYSSYHWATKASENAAPALAHAARTDNPHAVTATQVGLGNVSNTAQVTAVSGTAPIVSSGGTTPAISISAATTSTPGSMSSADKTKLDGIATNANNYVHPTADGSLHVPATGTTNSGKVLTAGATAGSLSWVTPAVTDLTVTAGTTGGPTINSSTGADVVIPSASGTNSGVVTTGAQTFAGVKTMTSPVLITPSIGVATGTSFNSITGLASVAPVMDGVATIGTSAAVARQDHVHPSDTSKTNVADLMMAIGNINSPLLDMPLKNSLAMKAGVGSATFTRASTATYIDRYGVLKTAAVSEPRFEKEGYLNEGASTNLLLYSEQFDNATWAKSTLTAVANTTETLDPYGTNLAEKISKSDGYGRIQQTPTVSAIPHTLSAYFKAGTADKVMLRMLTGAAAEVYTVELTLSTKTVTPLAGSGTYLLTELANGWFRLAITATFIDTTSLCIIYPDRYDTASTGSIYIFGAQLEALPFATSYIPTTTASVTRAADMLSVTRSGNIPKDVNGVLSVLCDVSSLGGTNSQGIFGIAGYSVNDYYYGGAGISANFNGFANSYTMTRNTTNSRIGLISDGITLSIAKDGVIVNSTSTTNIPTGTPTNILIGNIRTSVYPLYGHISNVRIYGKALSSQEISLA